MLGISMFLGLTCVCSAVEYRNRPLTAELIAADIIIVDIRTEPEWRETGVVPGAVLRTFYRQDRSYDLEGFISELRRYVAPGQPFAILCRRGNRSARVADMLAGRGFRSIINLSGGIRTAQKNGVRLIPYPDRE